MVAKLLNANPDIRIRVDGHVKMKKKYRKDEGKMKQAERLSQLRAKGVVKELIGFGIAKDRMDYKGFGGSVPLPKGQDDKRNEKDLNFVDSCSYAETGAVDKNKSTQAVAAEKVSYIACLLF